MGEVQWIKIYIDMFDKRKIKKLRRLPAGNELLLIWIMLLAMAGKCNAGGMIFITESIPFTEDDLADELNFDVNTIRLAIKAFEELEMISTDNLGFINITGWEEYQNTDKLAEIREKNRIAQQKSRAKKKLLQASNDVSSDSHVTSHNCHDIEEEGEGEEDKEKESHSFIPAENENVWKEEARLNYIGGTLGKGVVLMSEEQFGDLCDKLSWHEIDHYFGIVADCELKGKKFTKKTHYQAILDMVAKDRKMSNKTN